MSMPPLPAPTKFQNLLREIKFFGADAYTKTQLTEYAAAVRAATIEECAKVAEAYEPRCDSCPSGCAAAIRALATSAKPPSTP